MDAKDLVASRNHLYGDPIVNWTRTARWWSEILGVEVSPQTALRLMIAMKESRLENGPNANDQDDIAGYQYIIELFNARAGHGDG